MEYIAERTLRDGSSLSIIRWVSDVINPGQYFYQIEIHGHGPKMSFPHNYEKFTETEIREIHGFIESRNEFENLVLGIRN